MKRKIRNKQEGFVGILVILGVLGIGAIVGSAYYIANAPVPGAPVAEVGTREPRTEPIKVITAEVSGFPLAANIADTDLVTKTYTHTTYHFTLDYPTGFESSTKLSEKQTPRSIIPFCESGTASIDKACIFYIDKDTIEGFEAAGLVVQVQKAEEADCITSNGEKGTINNVDFQYESLKSSKLGHYLNTDSYHTYHDGMCYTVNLNIGSNNKISSEQYTGFAEEMKAKMQAALSTFKFTDN